jgi:GGDEF domain-containing protein
MDSVQRFVTLSGECFEAEFEREQTALPIRFGNYHLFKLHDVRSRRGDRLVSIFGTEQLQLLNPDYDTGIELARINVIRRAFDSGKLSFNEPYNEHEYKGLDITDSDFNPHPLVSDQGIRTYITLKAFWLSYMHATNPGVHGVSFDTPEDLEYLGAQVADIRRSVLRLQNQGMLDAGGRPTEKLIAACEPESISVESKGQVTKQKDPLVPLFNRSEFTRDIEELGATSNAASPMTLLMLDLDNFKEINDSAESHIVGDTALKSVAEVILRVTHRKGSGYRIGGDEVLRPITEPLDS